MSTVNLKAMFNDPSQMREALAWRLFDRAGVPASRHTYAKLALNATYMGLFSVVEQVDRRFLKDRLGDNDEGNLYKAACGQLGCATLERRVGSDGDDGGRQYIAADPGDQTYRLMTNEDDPASSAYEDLAQFIRVVEGAGLAGGDGRFDTDAYPVLGGGHPECPGVPALGGREPAHRQLGQLLRHALQLLPGQLRAAATSGAMSPRPTSPSFPGTTTTASASTTSAPAGRTPTSSADSGTGSPDRPT